MTTERQVYDHIGKITEVATKKDRTGNDYLSFAVEPERWTYILFKLAEKPAQAALVKVGNTVMVTYSKNGKFRRVEGIEAAAELPASPPSAHVTDRSESIIRQTCLKCATQLVVARVLTNPNGQYGTSEVKTIAGDLEEWANREGGR